MEFLEDDYNQQSIARLLKIGVSPLELEEATISVSKIILSITKPLSLTGSFESFGRDELKSKLENQFGAKVTGSVSKKTDFLLSGESAGSKLDKARELNITVIEGETEILKLISTWH